MVPTKYKIHQLSARAVMGYAKETAQGIYSFQLTHAATEKCKASTQVDQDDNALFYQIMDELHGGNFTLPTDGKVVTDLSEILFYMDFAGIFDRTGRQKKYIDRQKKAECMFRPEGITLDFGFGAHRYLAFERSASMSRRAMLSFIREDFYEPIRKRILLDPAILSAVSMLAQDHKHCLKRIRASRQPIKERSRQSDITKILFAQCQEDDYDTDVLYALFSALSQEQVTELYRAIRGNSWHLMPEKNREAFLRKKS